MQLEQSLCDGLYVVKLSLDRFLSASSTNYFCVVAICDVVAWRNRLGIAYVRMGRMGALLVRERDVQTGLGDRFQRVRPGH